MNDSAGVEGSEMQKGMVSYVGCCVRLVMSRVSSSSRRTEYAKRIMSVFEMRSE